MKAFLSDALKYTNCLFHFFKHKVQCLEESLELPHKAWKVILSLSDIITNISPLGSILTAKANAQVKAAQPKINDQLCVHGGKIF